MRLSFLPRDVAADKQITETRAKRKHVNLVMMRNLIAHYPALLIWGQTKNKINKSAADVAHEEALEGATTPAINLKSEL